ncbi:MAG: phosphodiester glycosidase family protein [Pyrinomonadaceae bacterium]|nr:phosphodiester glycosidase family protein [Pyrinomonadaceae bacterium]
MFSKSLSIIFLLLLSFSALAQNFQQIADGIEYAEVVRGTEKEPIRANLLRLDLTKVRLDVVHALDAAIGLEKTSSIATRHGAIAAINAGFFRLDKSLFAGDDVGILKIDGDDLSEATNNRIAIFINNTSSKTEVEIEHFTSENFIEIKKEKIKISGINRERKADEIIVFTPFFHRTTLTDSNGTEIIVKKGKITQVLDGKGSSEIPSDGFVISASGKKREEILKTVKIGLKVRKFGAMGVPMTRNNGVLSIPTKDIFVISALSEDIVAGVPQLIKNGKIEITWEQEKTNKSFVETKHPRTAVAKLKDGKFLMVTVDGRSESSGGMSLQQLAEFLLEQGATDAMNLDGGGSTTMFLDGKVVNHPSDKEGERSVGDAILVFPRKKQ